MARKRTPGSNKQSTASQARGLTKDAGATVLQQHSNKTLRMPQKGDRGGGTTLRPWRGNPLQDQTNKAQTSRNCAEALEEASSPPAEQNACNSAGRCWWLFSQPSNQAGAPDSQDGQGGGHEA
eukprot:CAMPEP_0204155502 /NCGR_PEP_ID=MMETSP0361-20130328/29639_1 /ASSEMBLY_ACC=CAM_ASM_000343 /TAXON_ID=268821 /ORGANISM="Scrippsiella Hangoei, Strain SHTV-5" /LENGTH=122 /DNA_ID=CAMNT_0051110985 /DNA_START=282 /DNA_END=648 /DNA_ORIENTATION=+